MVREPGENDLLLELVENTQRKWLSDIEEADALIRLVREMGCEMKAVAAQAGRSEAYVSKRVRVFEDPILRQAVEQNQLPVSVAEEFLGMPAEQRPGLGGARHRRRLGRLASPRSRSRRGAGGPGRATARQAERRCYLSGYSRWNAHAARAADRSDPPDSHARPLAARAASISVDAAGRKSTGRLDADAIAPGPRARRARQTRAGFSVDRRRRTRGPTALTARRQRQVVDRLQEALEGARLFGAELAGRVLRRQASSVRSCSVRSAGRSALSARKSGDASRAAGHHLAIGIGIRTCDRPIHVGRATNFAALLCAQTTSRPSYARVGTWPSTPGRGRKRDIRSRTTGPSSLAPTARACRPRVRRRPSRSSPGAHRARRRSVR